MRVIDTKHPMGQEASGPVSAAVQGENYAGKELLISEGGGPQRKLKLTKRLAAGGFGAAYSAVDAATGDTLCVKIPHSPTDESVRREARLAARVKGYEQFAPRVVSAEYRGWFATVALSSVAVMPLAPYGTLKSLCEEPRITATNVEDCWRMLADNIEAIHAAGIFTATSRRTTCWCSRRATGRRRRRPRAGRRSRRTSDWW